MNSTLRLGISMYYQAARLKDSKTKKSFYHTYFCNLFQFGFLKCHF